MDSDGLLIRSELPSQRIPGLEPDSSVSRWILTGPARFMRMIAIWARVIKKRCLLWLSYISSIIGQKRSYSEAFFCGVICSWSTSCLLMKHSTSREAKPVQEPPPRRPHQVPRPDPPDRWLLGRPGVVPVRPRHASRRQLPQLPHHHPQDGQPLRGGLRLHPPRLHGHALPRLPGRVLALHHQDGAGLQGRYLFSCTILIQLARRN
ncbi:hypothetical protein AVEN_7346-1 [Araneus ventricosus]|uniref:Uncharacterized protein n=1 Tax=Araneus ventricosus TaxID=182803 RepID=A0A4Y2BQ86_ARAVE|nr:hypothetical protein AVEN_7346-1 [Araneus ventricosus]